MKDIFHVFYHIHIILCNLNGVHDISGDSGVVTLLGIEDCLYP
jgi:hypothetical protein